MIYATPFWLVFLKCASVIIFTVLFLQLNKKLAPIVLLSYLLFSTQNISAILWEFDTISLVPALVMIIYYSIIKREMNLTW